MSDPTMLMPDVNVLVNALREDSSDHERAWPWLADALATRHEQIGLTPAVVSGYVRIVTHPRVFADPTPLEGALRNVEQLLQTERVLTVGTGARFWLIFADLCRQVRARGALVSDVAHAATAIEAGATWVTFDRDFTRFPGLRYQLL